MRLWAKKNIRMDERAVLLQMGFEASCSREHNRHQIFANLCTSFNLLPLTSSFAFVHDGGAALQCSGISAAPKLSQI